MKLDDQEELLWKLTYRVSELSTALADIGALLASYGCSDNDFADEVARIVMNASTQSNESETSVDICVRALEESCTTN